MYHTHRCTTHSQVCATLTGMLLYSQVCNTFTGVPPHPQMGHHTHRCAPHSQVCTTPSCGLLFGFVFFSFLFAPACSGDPYSGPLACMTDYCLSPLSSPNCIFYMRKQKLHSLSLVAQCPGEGLQPASGSRAHVKPWGISWVEPCDSLPVMPGSGFREPASSLCTSCWGGRKSTKVCNP